MAKSMRAAEKTPAQLREAKGQTLRAAALAIGISPITLEKIEAGARGVTVGALERAAAYYCVTLTALVAGCERARLAVPA